MGVTKTGAGDGLSDDTFMKSGDGRIYWAEIDFENPVVTYLCGCEASARCKGERGNRVGSWVVPYDPGPALAPPRVH